MDVPNYGTVVEVAYRELNHGVLTVEAIHLACGAVEVSEEPEVAPVQPTISTAACRSDTRVESAWAVSLRNVVLVC